MKRVFGYIRVSTVKQGTGVSLQEQKEAIIRYAEKHQLNIIEWFVFRPPKQSDEVTHKKM